MNGKPGKQNTRRKVISFQHKAKPLFKSELKRQSKKNKGGGSRRQFSKRNFVRASWDVAPDALAGLFRTDDFGKSHRLKKAIGQESMMIQKQRKSADSQKSSREIKNNYSSYNNSIGAAKLDIENFFQNSRRHIRKKSFHKQLEEKIMRPKLAITFHRELEQGELNKKLGRTGKSKRQKNRKNRDESGAPRKPVTKKPRISRRNIVSRSNTNMELFRSQNINKVKYKETEQKKEEDQREEIKIIDCDKKKLKIKKMEKTRERDCKGKNSRVPGRFEARKVFKKFKNIKREAALGNQLGKGNNKAGRVRESRRAIKNRDKHFETANLPLGFSHKNNVQRKRNHVSKAKYKTNGNLNNGSRRGFACSVTGYQENGNSRRKRPLIGSFSQIHNKKIEKSELFFQAFKKKKLTPKGKGIHPNTKKKLNSSSKISIGQIYKNPSGSKIKNHKKSRLNNSYRRKEDQERLKIIEKKQKQAGSKKSKKQEKKLDKGFKRAKTMQEESNHKPRTFHEEYSEYSGGKDGFSASDMDNSMEYGSNRKLKGMDYSSETGLERKTANGRVGELFPIIKRVRIGDTSLNGKHIGVSRERYVRKEKGNNKEKGREGRDSVKRKTQGVVTYQEKFKLLREERQNADRKEKRKRFKTKENADFLKKMKAKFSSNQGSKNALQSEKEFKISSKNLDDNFDTNHDLETLENTELEFFQMKQDENILNDLSLHRSNIGSNFGSNPEMTTDMGLESKINSKIKEILLGNSGAIGGIKSDIYLKSALDSRIDKKTQSHLEIVNGHVNRSQNSLIKGVGSWNSLVDGSKKKSQKVYVCEPRGEIEGSQELGQLYRRPEWGSSKTELTNQKKQAANGNNELANFASNQDPFKSPKADLYGREKAKSFMKSQYFSEKTPKSRSFLNRMDSGIPGEADESHGKAMVIKNFLKKDANQENRKSTLDQLKKMLLNNPGKKRKEAEKIKIENHVHEKESINGATTGQEVISKLDQTFQKQNVKTNPIGSTKTDKTGSTAIQIDLKQELLKQREPKNQDLRDRENELKWEKIKLKKEKNKKDKARGRSRRSQMGVPLKMPSMRERRNRLSRIYNWKGREEQKEEKRGGKDQPEASDWKIKKRDQQNGENEGSNEPNNGTKKNTIDLGTGKGFFRKIARKDGRKKERARQQERQISEMDHQFEENNLNTPPGGDIEENGASEINMKKVTKSRRKSAKERAFQVEKIIGQGSFANVYLVTSRKTKQELVLKVTKSKNQEALKEQRLLNQINHPNILFSYGIVYPQEMKRFDFKNLDKWIPKNDNRSNMKSVDKLMKKNKYGELEFADLERGKQKLFKPIAKTDFLEGNHTRRGVSRRKRMSKVSVSPNQIRKRMNFNFSSTCKDVSTGKGKGAPGVDKFGRNLDGKKTKKLKREERGPKPESKREQYRMKRGGLQSRNSKFRLDTKISKELENIRVDQKKVGNEYRKDMSRSRANMSRTQNRKNNVSISRNPKKVNYVVYKKLRMWKLDLFKKLDVEAHLELEKKKGRKMVFYPKNRDITVEMVQEYRRVLDSGNFAMLLEYCGERTLEDLIRFKFKNGFGEKRAIRLFISLAKAVAHLHSLKIAHCDIKLENVLIDRELSKPKLIDFGLSVQNTNLISDYCAGTPSYMSPQLLRKHPYNPYKSDIWALGVLFFKLLYGFLPYKGKTPDLILKRIDNLGLSFPKTIKISRTVQECISNMLRIQENQRPEILELLHTHFPKLCPKETE